MNIENIISLLKKGFYKHNLVDLLVNCDRILINNEDNQLLFFTLKGLFQDLLDFFENTPVILEHEKILTDGLQQLIIDILENVNKPSSQLSSMLESLVSKYYSNKVNLQNFQ